MLLNKQQVYLPPLLVSIFLVIQANFLSGHRSRHTAMESGEDNSRLTPEILKEKTKHWTNKWDAMYYGDVDRERREEGNTNPAEDLTFYEENVKWKLNDEGNNRKYSRVII
ncbi:hypothetical protein RUM43_000945 [Polyplax serrata]|uniref:Uncharacterized protein n=1 Tax=Polyplax serrata TaxID=468196 RepID=A0AAN8SGW3_POLSC